MGLVMMLVYDGDKIVSWCKANAIHKWFVDNVQDGVDDCREYKVTKEHLIQLQNKCNEVLDNPNLAKELLPTQSGSFFGETVYEDGYYVSLDYTLQIIDEILETKPYCLDDLYYSSSW
jgi:hypothetical protein